MQKPTEGKGWHEDFARFFENPSRESLRKLLQYNAGEADRFDFKSEWPTFPKVARHVLALANSGGGCLVVGVEEKDDKTFDTRGLNILTDKTDIQKGIQKFLHPRLSYEVLDFSFDSSEYSKIIDKKFQVLIVDDMPEYLPFISRGGGEGIRENAIYVRRGTSSEEVNYEELQRIIDRRLQTDYRSKEGFELERHLVELKTLYRQIPRFRSASYLLEMLGAAGGVNPSYPHEDYDEYVARLIEAKKAIISKSIERIDD